ncbi:hypothetical protein EW146_g166 [Bondarzewia mesenterica]|uniref:type I protein arginine methyltransferase n=1 Tax=Bondarzewia mesenterica TaxID=1095465 RepID=A0A4S4M9G4_9AGAM|nr:hypothetical protein EW146_g166 [Bondarzewia mesenterica]
MSLRLPAAPLNLSDVGSEDGNDTSVSGEEEETWSDWISDSMNEQPCRSLFEEKILPTVSDALNYDKQTHGFDLSAACSKLSLDFHGRIRLINYIRKEKPTAQSLQSLEGNESFLSSDDYLRPVLEDDPLLLNTSDEWSDSGDEEVAPTNQVDAQKRMRSLERKLRKAKQDLADYNALITQHLDIGRLKEAVEEPGSIAAESKAPDDDSHYFQSYEENDIHAVMIQDSIRTSSYASFILTNPKLFQDAIVLDVGCGTGILSLFAARAGAKRVIAVDASDIAEKAKLIVKANNLDDVITVIQGKVENITLPDNIEKVDIIVSEWMGYALLYESMLDSVLSARDRFLKPDGVLAPSQCKMILGLCEAGEIFKERIGFWNDVYGFDLSAMAEEVYDDAVVDVVGPDTMLSEAFPIKDLYLRDITTRQLDFIAPFTLVSTAERRTKVRALVLYFDTFFHPLGEPVPPDTQVQITKDGGGHLAEVWPIGGRQPRRSSQTVKARITSFSTGPKSVPTHWKHTIFLLRDPIQVEEGTVVTGTFRCRKSEDNARELDVEIHYTIKDNADSEVPGEVVVQMFKVRTAQVGLSYGDHLLFRSISIFYTDYRVDARKYDSYHPARLTAVGESQNISSPKLWIQQDQMGYISDALNVLLAQVDWVCCSFFTFLPLFCIVTPSYPVFVLSNNSVSMSNMSNNDTKNGGKVFSSLLSNSQHPYAKIYDSTNGSAVSKNKTVGKSTSKTASSSQPEQTTLKLDSNVQFGKIAAKSGWASPYKPGGPSWPLALKLVDQDTYIIMQPMPNRLGLGLRQPLPSYGQGPSMSALAQQQQMHHQQFVPPQAHKEVTLFIGSISGGITDAFLNQLLSACGPVKSFKRLITPANKPQGFGFAEFEDPDGALRAMALLNNVELPALEDGCMSKKLLVKADEKTKMFLDAYSTQRMQTDVDEVTMQKSKATVGQYLADINRTSQEASNNGLLDKERYVIPPHLHDLQEADLPETQRGLVISEIAQFRERAAKREREKMRDSKQSIPSALPSGPKVREWGKPQAGATPEPTQASRPGALGKDAQQGYSKPVGFVKAEQGQEGDERQLAGKTTKTDEELEAERKEARRRDEENSFRDRERRYEPRERTRIQNLERAITREQATKEAEGRDKVEMGARLDVWDDDESDELFYTDRTRWRMQRTRRLAAEEAADAESRAF